MFGKFSLIAALVVPFVSALTLRVPENPTSGGPVTLRWDSAAGDPDTWSFFLFNEVFHNSFGIANNVDPAPQELALTLPIVPVGGGYTLQATNIGNVSEVYASTPTFSIGEVSSSSITSSGSSSSSSSRSTSSRSTTTTTTRSSVSISGTPSSTSDTSSASASVSAVAPFSGAESFLLGSNIASVTTVLFSVAVGAVLFVL